MMLSLLMTAPATTTLLIIISILILRRLRASQSLQTANEADHKDVQISSIEPTILSQSLASALPDTFIFPHDVAAFKQSVNSYWAQQECEVVPACVVRPRDVQELSTAVTILKRENDERGQRSGDRKAEGRFAVRSGGHSPVSGAASIKGGVLIDLSVFREVTPSDDGSHVFIGAGAKWMDVSKVPDEKGLAVVGGRNSAVGVGGLTLGGKLLLFCLLMPLSLASIAS